ncbi:MAG TPA: hypothetical protein VH277_14885, partial [Gemmatimonadaceae bacterium]|nr:hypothetical protein [Gemmatimonadaceae bacterium]
MSGQREWPAMVFAAAERIARNRYDAGSMPFDRLARAAARLGLADDARRLAVERDKVQPAGLAGLARVYAALGDRAAIDRLRARTALDARADPA